MSNKEPVVNYIYSHIGNGGVTFKVTNDNGPTLEVEANHFGHTINSMKLHVDKATLRAIGEMLIKASESDSFDKEYCCAPETHVYELGTNKPIYMHNGEKRVMSFGESSN